MTTRRGFLKLSGASVAALLTNPTHRMIFPPDDDPPERVGMARVAAQVVYRYSQASFQSQRIGHLKRDQIIDIYEEIDSPNGPAYNPRWYRLSEGYAHSGRLQRVDGAYFHRTPLQSVPESGQLGEICVPWTQSYRQIRTSDWTPLYRLYYQSVHWITAIEYGPGGSLWYRLTDDLLHAHHYVSALHVRPIPPEELDLISPTLHPDDKHILVSIDEQRLTAFEGDKVALRTKVSTGMPTETPLGMLPTETPRGRFRVQTKMPSRHMGEGNLTADLEAYELPGVPWVCFFHKEGIALHGTYWHDNFGRAMSHGCINMRNEDAKWLYRWTTPIATAQDWYSRGLGTLLEIV